MNRWTRLVATAANVIVAAVAGLISYTHIYALTLALHQDLLAARIYAVGVDGLIVVGSMAILNKLRWGWAAIGFGLIVSLYANFMSGLAHGGGLLAALWAAVPALAFFLATFILERWIASRGDSPESDDAVLRAAHSMALDVLEAHAALRSAQSAITSASHVVAASTALLVALPAISIPAPEPVTEVRPARTLPTRGGRKELPIVNAVESAPAVAAESVSEPAPSAAPRPRPSAPSKTTPKRTPKAASKRSSSRDPRAHFKDLLDAGKLPSVRQVAREMHVGAPKAKEILAELATV